MHEPDEIARALTSVQGELSVAEAELQARRAGEQAELDTLTKTAAELTERRKALEEEQWSLAQVREAAEETRRKLAAEQLRLRERLGATMWASVAVGLLCAMITPYGLASGTSLLILLVGQVAAAGGAYLLALLLGRRRG